MRLSRNLEKTLFPQKGLDNKMKSPYANRDWSLAIECKWVPKRGIETTLRCPRCEGSGLEPESFGSLKYYDDDRQFCMNADCHSGRIKNPDVLPKPEMPIIFRKQMVAAMNGFLKNMRERAIKNRLDVK